MPDPLFSIITVTLNAGRALRATAESVANQTFPGYEHVIKDGGSSDGSLECLPENSRLRIVTSPDKGIYHAMNQALAECRGCFILFLNAGDLLATPDILKELAPHLSGDNTVELLYCDYVDLEARYRIASPVRLGGFFLFRTMLCHQVCFIRSDAYQSHGGFDTAFAVAADYEFLAWLVLRRRASYVYIPLVCTHYRGGGFSTLPSNRRRLSDEVRKIRARYFPPGRRLVYTCILALTLPSIRNALNRSPTLRFLRPWYLRCANAANRLLGGGRFRAIEQGGRQAE